MVVTETTLIQSSFELPIERCQSTFFFSKNSSSNCENDVDSFILKLGNISNARTKTRTMYKDLDREKVLDEDLQAVARTPPQFSMVEDNILVYIAGYLAHKAYKKFSCLDCYKVWQDTSKVPNEQNTFMKHKQYQYCHESGLYFPSDSLLNFVSHLEQQFRTVSNVFHTKGLLLKYILVVNSASDVPSVTSSCENCCKYVIRLFFVVRIHHFLREQNRTFQLPGGKRNRKVMKLLHI